jgi:hypothetical protein
MIEGTARLDGPWTKEERDFFDECQAAADAEGKYLRDWLIEQRDGQMRHGSTPIHLDPYLTHANPRQVGI